jgi:hypothetical protein
VKKYQNSSAEEADPDQGQDPVQDQSQGANQCQHPEAKEHV